MAEFSVGDQYTRDEIAERIGMPPERRKGGAWATGYDEWRGEAFVFANVGGPGRTGHDYGNRWQGKDLVWFGKTGSRRGQPQIDRLISNTVPAHIFWRGKDRSPFSYAGMGMAMTATSGTPVEVVWTFEKARSPSAVEGSIQALHRDTRFRRGPPPAVGESTVVRTDGETEVYLMQLEGPAGAIVDLPSGHHVIKVGMSSDVNARVNQLNSGFPPGSKVRWEVVRTRKLQNGVDAFAAEGQCLEELRRKGFWTGGEFAVMPTSELEQLLK